MSHDSFTSLKMFNIFISTKSLSSKFQSGACCSPAALSLPLACPHGVTWSDLHSTREQCIGSVSIHCPEMVVTNYRTCNVQHLKKVKSSAALLWGPKIFHRIILCKYSGRKSCGDPHYWNKTIEYIYIYIYVYICVCVCVYIYTECPRRNGQNFGRVFLMLNYTDITQNTYIQSWMVMEIMAIKKCGLLGCPRTVRRPWRHTCLLCMPGNETPLANIVMQWPWRDNASAVACVKYLET